MLGNVLNCGFYIRQCPKLAFSFAGIRLWQKKKDIEEVTTMNKENQTNAQKSFVVSRREILAAGGATLIGATLFGPSFSVPVSGQNIKGTMAKNGGMKPTILPSANSKDPVDFSVAENAFWNEQLMEHAIFFGMLMPGPELADERAEAARFQQNFAAQLQKAKTARLDKSNYAAFNRSTVEMVKPFVDWKRKNGALQASGKLKSLTWSTFFEHTANEADRFARRLEQFSRGDTSADMRETARFWAMIMGEHADFIAHLLDPKETALINKAMQTADAFHKMHDNPPASTDPAAKAVDEIIDFKTAAGKGINAGTIKSIIHPTLADHVRREALKAADELRRAGAG